MPGLKPGNDARWISAGRKLFARYVAERGMPDVLHAHAMFMGGVIGADLARAHSLPLVITEHSTVYQRRAIPDFQVREGRNAIAAADALLAVSPGLAEEMQRVFGDVAARAEWVPNVVDGSFFSAGRACARSARFAFSRLATSTRRRGMPRFCPPSPRSSPATPTCSCAWAGMARSESACTRLRRSLGIAEQVVWLGALTRAQVAEEMLAADAFVLASRIETFGVVVAEALASGLPVVATRSGGPEWIVGEEDGLLVEPDSVEQLGEAMVRMREGAVSYDADAIRRRCEERFGEAALVRRLGEVYARVTGGGEAR